MIYEKNVICKEEVKQLAELHMRAFPSFFLTQLGRSFLCALYNGYAEDKESGLIIAEDNGSVIGFIAYSNDYSKFYKGLIKKHLVKFALCSLRAAIMHPSYIKRLLGAFKKSDMVVKKEQYVELASICVDPDRKREGIGSKLIEYLKNKVDFSKFVYINLETDAEGNDEVNNFYQRNGFVLEREYTTAEGRKMNEYRYRPVEET
ncbi:MAG: GNAT family N-acetyltransferase [Clostridiales bacterium]|nr:GNAT family N-acetyltransferase [Clostridiales bacterium]